MNIIKRKKERKRRDGARTKDNVEIKKREERDFNIDQKAETG